jgi:LPXTG-motif cell wall-anchored protein
VTVDGELALGGGTLRVTLPEGADLSAGIPVLAGSAVQGEFSDLEVVGAPEDAELSLEYANGQVLLVEGAQDDATQEPAPTQTGEPTEAPTSEPTSTPTDDATQSPDEDGQDDGRDEDARGDDQLPRTGAQVTALVGIALALVAGGTAALTIARRRRI